MFSIFKLCRVQFCSSTKQLLKINIKKPSKDGYDKSQFLDLKVVSVKGGNGGDGTISLSKVFCNPHNGPDGGDGGNGGHVIVKASSLTKDLKGLASLINGINGNKGMGKGKHGANAEHIIIDVPVGTFVKDFETKTLLADLVNDEDIFVAVRGGEGGKGNQFFLSQEHRAPTIAEQGGIGEQRKLILEVKLLADIGLVGIPNAGKSTLLRALTRATPKVANYAFTTLRPHVGKIEFSDPLLESISICDIPGIIEDSHKNRGLGLEFLRHIERCHILAFVIDLSNNPIDQFHMLTNELNSYRPLLLSIPRLIICNKMDLEGTRNSYEKFRSYLSKLNDTSTLLAISALNSVNLQNLIFQMINLRDKNILDINK